jgi:hypothetical protein
LVFSNTSSAKAACGQASSQADLETPNNQTQTRPRGMQVEKGQDQILINKFEKDSMSRGSMDE